MFVVDYIYECLLVVLSDSACLPTVCACVFLWYTEFVKKLEGRNNLVELPDPLYEWLPRVDTSIPVTIILWISFAVFVLNFQQVNFHVACWSWMFFMVARATGIYLHPFKGHRDMIPLQDPIIDHFLGVSKPLRNDLFISGHCGTLSLMGMLLYPYMPYYLSACMLTALLMILSRVHYTADCLLAPMFSLFSFYVGQSCQSHIPHRLWGLLFLYPYHIRPLLNHTYIEPQRLQY
jgi:hypothetical protein